MDRSVPIAHTEEIELYLRTYYSLLRSSEPIRLRSLEETHSAMKSTIHHQASSPEIDMSALVYSALRLPECVPYASTIVMGQMDEVFEREGYDVTQWESVRARARRRKFYFNAQEHTLAASIASVSDIDDLIPCLVAFQIEWNKLNQKLVSSSLHNRLIHQYKLSDKLEMELMEDVRDALDLDSGDLTKLSKIWPGKKFLENLRLAATTRLDIRGRVLGSGLSDYRRSVQFWWRQVEKGANEKNIDLSGRPIYFVSSNPHSLVNLTSGTGWKSRDELIRFVQAENPENLTEEYHRLSNSESAQMRNLLYYTLGRYLSHSTCPATFKEQAAADEAAAGIVRVSDPLCLDVEAQVFELSQMNVDRVDPRAADFTSEEWALLAQSDALIFNIDYPLGMAAYHLFNQISSATWRTLGVYILGKAATLNGRVGDIMLPNVVYDDHSRNSYLFRNCFTARDLTPLLNYGSVFDNQKAVTVRGTFLQNRNFMHVFYEEGYTDIEMEAGPYLSSIYEDIYPRRYPLNEIVNLFINAPYDIGLIHYASDTPISRLQTLLSTSLSYAGVDSTYASSLAVLRHILSKEVERQRQHQKDSRQKNLTQTQTQGTQAAVSIEQSGNIVTPSTKASSAKALSDATADSSNANSSDDD